MNNRLLRPLANGFNPKSIAGLAAWWDSTDNSTITTDTGVSAWADKSGNGYTLEQSTGANQPTLSTINGRQAFDYNGSSQYLLATDAGLAGEASGSSVNDTTIFYVGEIDAVSSSAYAAAFGRSASDVPIYAALHVIQSGSVWRVLYRGDPNVSLNVSSTAQYATGTPYVAVQSTGNNIVGRVNGAQVISTSNSNSADAMTIDQFSVGVLARTSATGYWDGRIGDVLIYNRVLTLAEIQRVERWLAGRFGVTLA